MAVLLELVLVLVVLVVIGTVLFRAARGAPRRGLDPRLPPAVPPPVLPVRRGPWTARYEIEGNATVWMIVRTLTDARGPREESHEVVRIDSAAPDFDERFVAGERKAHERALLLNSSLSP